MDDQFLIIKSPKDGVKGQFHYYSGSLLLKDHNTRMMGDEILGFIRPWGSDDVYTFENPQRLLNQDEFKKLSAHLSFAGDDDKNTTTKNQFNRQIDLIKEEIELNEFEKVVLSRIKWMDKNLEFQQVVELFNTACNAYPNSLVYILNTHEFGTWIGASPEVLIEIDGNLMKTVSLAGTLFSENENWTDKERQEQSITARHISESFQQMGLNEDLSEVGEVVNGPIRHLVQIHQTDISNINVNELMMKLHPTPAVAGYPVKKAIEFIANTELHPRELYTGFIGDSKEVYVNLRCARIFSDGIKLFAGCGINAKSNADREWEETELKMRVISDLIGI